MRKSSRKLMRKFIITVLLFILCVSTIYSCFAFDIGTKQVKALRWCDQYLKYKGEVMKTTYAAFEKDGKYYPAYCLNQDLDGVGSAGVNEYDVIGNSKLQDENVWKAIINGYPYKSLNELGAANEDEAFTATKFAVYTLMKNQNVEDYESVGTPDGNRVYQVYLDIVKNARASKEVLTNNNKISITAESNNWILEDSKEYISKTYKFNSIVSNGNFKINLEGEIPEGSLVCNLKNENQSEFKTNEKFKILIPIEKIKNKGNFKINIKSQLETKPVVYGKTTLTGKQNYALTGYMMEDVNTSIEDSFIDNTTKITILKKEVGSEKVLEGVKFYLLNDKEEVLKENLETDSNGQIVIDKLVPGKYYLKEVETLDGYNLYNDLIEINLSFNEQINVLVNNSLKSFTELENKTETVEVNSNYTETVYNVENANKVVNKENIKKLPVTGY